MPEIPSSGLRGNDATDEHLWKHGLLMRDADRVWMGPAKYFDQGAELEMDEGGRLHERPDRLVMIGPESGGRLLTFILELPDQQGESHVVTGWVATRAQRSRYHQPGGRMRLR